MRLPTEAGRERKDKKSKEGRYQGNAIKLVVSILPAHTAACNIYGTTRSEQMDDKSPLTEGNIFTTYRSLPRMRTFRPWSSALRKCA